MDKCTHYLRYDGSGLPLRHLLRLKSNISVESAAAVPLTPPSILQAPNSI